MKNHHLLMISRTESTKETDKLPIQMVQPLIGLKHFVQNALPFSWVSSNGLC